MTIGTMQFDPVKVQYLIYYMTNEDTMQQNYRHDALKYPHEFSKF